MADPISRLQLAKTELDRVMGVGYSAQHPEVFAVVVQSAASDWAASRVALAIEQAGQLVAEALVEEDAGGIVQPTELLRVRP